MGTENNFLDSFYLDLRALAAFRIGLGLILIYDLIIRAQWLVMHYTNAGILPVELLKNDLWQTGYWSLHALSGSVELQAVLFILAGIAALGLLLGYQTRLCAIVSWVLLVSLHNRNPLVLNSADVYLRLLLFWSIFLPLGAVFSIDSRKKKKPGRFKYASIASLCFILQIMLVYVMTALYKHSGEWLWDGTAIYYALSLGQMAKPLGHWLLQIPNLLTALTHGTVILELLFPFLFILPFKNTLCRALAIIAFASFHTGLWFTMELGIFVPVCLVALVAIIPSGVMDKGIRRIKQLPAPKMKSAFLKALKPQTAGGIMKVDRSPAWVDKLINSVLTGLLAVVLAVNIIPLAANFYKMPRGLKTFATIVHLDQTWNMFAPSVFKVDGWFITKGVMKDGTETDLFHETKIQWHKPENMLDYYISERWRKYFMRLYRRDENKYYRILAQVLKNRWNKTHKKELEQFIYLYMLEYTRPSGQKPAIEKQVTFKKRY